MKIYFCSCAYCRWKGNKPHRDGQCPVCGQGLKIQIRERRCSADLSPKVCVSGLSTDSKLTPPVANLSLLGRFKISDRDLEELRAMTTSVKQTLGSSLDRIRQSSKAIRLLELRFHGDED